MKTINICEILIEQSTGDKFMVTKTYPNNEIIIALKMNSQKYERRAISKDEILNGYYTEEE